MNIGHFMQVHYGRRITIVVAGVVMNALLAVAIYYVFLAMGNFQTTLPLIGNHHFFGVDQKVTTQIEISEVEKNSPAAQAGITPFSTIESVNGQKIEQIDTFAQEIKANAGQPITISWKDEKTTKRTYSNSRASTASTEKSGSDGCCILSGENSNACL